MLIVILIPVILVVIGALVFAILKSTSNPKHLAGIEKLIKQGKYAAAIKAAKAMIQKNPQDFKAHYALGQAYLADNKAELALMELKIVNKTAIFDQDIDERVFRNQIASLYSKFRQYEDALKEYILLTKLEPTNAEHYYNAAKIFEEHNKPEQALSYYLKTIQLNKRHAKAHAALALLYYRGKNIQEAKNQIDIAIRLNPDTFSAYYYQGKIFKNSKDFTGALNSFEKSARDPEFKQKSLIERGSCYLALNDMDRAISEYERAIKATKDENSQETLYARYFLAACYEKSRKIDSALEQWQKIASVNKNFKDVSSKIQEYKALQTSDQMKEFLTASDDNFIEICKKMLLQEYNLSPTKITKSKVGCTMIATQNKKDNWMSVREQIFLVYISRDSEPVDENIIRKAADEIKTRGYMKGLIFACTDFAPSIVQFVENRPIELIGKQKLMSVLSKLTF